MKFNITELTAFERDGIIFQVASENEDVNIPEDASVFKFADEHGGLYAIEDHTSYVFWEDQGTLFHPEDEEAIIEAIEEYKHKEALAV